MTEKKSLVEEAIIQMKNLEEAVAENAKGILASTMRQEIKELVKESLKEEDDEEVEDEGDEMDMEDDEMEMDMDMDDEEMEMDMDMEDDEMEMEEPDMEDETIDLTNEPTSEVLRVFKLLSPEDEIVVTKDSSGNINLKDKQTDKEYMIVKESYHDLEEGDDDFDMMEMMGYDDELNEIDSELEGEFEKAFGVEEEYDTDLFEMDDEEMDYESDMDDEEMDYESDMDDEEMDFVLDMGSDEEEEEEEEQEEGYSLDEVIYELEMNVDEEDYDMGEEDYMMEAKKSFKAKGLNMGNAKSYTMSKNPNMEGGFKTVGKKADKMMGTGNAKKVKLYKSDSPSLDGEFKKKPTHKKERSEGMTVKKMETKEASRTLGNGKYWGREGLPKPKAAPRHIRKESIESQEVELLKEKNEEYRKALNIFRNKLNEVAIFNSNLAYATRLFTEHSTSKQEKINILKRFDGVETLKESKNLYKVIKDELSNSMPQQVNESMERTISKTPTTGSAINLIESKTYENPQFQRMKDLMGKLK